MGSANRNGMGVRGFAVFVAAYCALASGRALVPGLCATLADLQSDVAYCHGPEAPCCQGHAADTGVAMTHPAHDCAFCALVHSGVPLEPAIAILPSAFSTPLQLAAHDGYVPDPTATGACMRRGPPLF